MNISASGLTACISRISRFFKLLGIRLALFVELKSLCIPVDIPPPVCACPDEVLRRL